MKRLRTFRDAEGYLLAVAFDPHDPNGRAGMAAVLDIMTVDEVVLDDLSQEERKVAQGARFGPDAATVVTLNPSVGQVP